jgi:AraC-like DNA-binding protein
MKASAHRFATKVQPPDDKKQLSDNRLQIALAYMERYSGEIDCIREVAELVGLSRSRFDSLFRAKTGQPPGRYLACFRLERAKSLLETGAPLKSIAAESGFASVSHFERKFKAFYGLSPSQFRIAREHSAPPPQLARKISSEIVLGNREPSCDDHAGFGRLCQVLKLLVVCDWCNYAGGDGESADHLLLARAGQKRISIWDQLGSISGFCALNY